MPSVGFLRSSAALWKARHTFRHARLGLWRRRRALRLRRWERLRDTRPEGDPERVSAWRLVEDATAQVRRWRRLRDEASERLRRRRRQLREAGGRRPRIVPLTTRARGRYGAIGTLSAVTGHYTAERADRSDADALDLFRRYDAFHDSQWGDGIAYHYGITREGTLVLLRPTRWRGTGVAGANTGNVHIVCPGTAGTNPTALQAGTLRWLHANAHRRAMPSSHRVPVRLSRLETLGHTDWPSPGGDTACPGGFRRMFLTRGRAR